MSKRGNNKFKWREIITKQFKDLKLVSDFVFVVH